MSFVHVLMIHLWHNCSNVDATDTVVIDEALAVVRKASIEHAHAASGRVHVHEAGADMIQTVVVKIMMFQIVCLMAAMVYYKASHPDVR